MARRSWYVAPDTLKQTYSGEEMPVVSRQAQIEAMVEATVMADRAGGTVMALFGRKPTGFPNEMVTTELVVTWQDRGDARPQPEEEVELAPPAPDVEAGETAEQAAGAEDGDLVTVGAEDEPAEV